MDKRMKRKQFHLTVAEERILYEYAKKHHMSEAEVVRIAIQEYDQRHQGKHNALVEMGLQSLVNPDDNKNCKEDLSERHDQYLLEINAHEKQ